MSTAFDSALAGPPSISPPGIGSNKYDEYDLQALKSVATQENAPSQPQAGTASQGALEPSPPGEAASPAFNEGGKGEARKPALDGAGPQDMLSLFNSASEEDKDELTKQQVDALSPHGKSLEGGIMDVFKAGGPQAMARAAQFGVDLTPFANKLNPGSGEIAVGQAMGNVPSDENAGQPAFKTTGQAVSDQRGREEKHRAGIVAKKKAQKDAIAAFLMETGLRILASNRDDVGGAMGEAALGTMESGRQRKREAQQDTIAENQRKRTSRRQDEADEARKVEASARADDRRIAAEETEYKKSQRGAAEAKVERSGRQEVTNDKGEVYSYDPLNPEKGKWVIDKDGNRVKSKDVGLSAAQIATNARAYTNARAKARTAIEKDIKDYNTQYPQIAEETDSTKKKALIDAAVDDILVRDGYDQSGNSVENYSELDW